MNFNSSGRMSLLLAASLAFISGITLVSIKYFNANTYVFVAITVSLIVFIISYLILFYGINNLIINKIKPLFDTIDTLKMPKEMLYRGIEEDKLLDDIENKVIEWAKTKVYEIDLLKANEKYRKEFLGNVSHELKTPLFNIQGYISTLIDGGIDDEEINFKYLKKTDKNINRLISIVHDLETISKLETGERLLQMSVFDIVHQISDVFEMHEIRAKSKKINLRFDKKYTKPILVKADKKSISEVLDNLIINSIIYGSENGFTQVDLKIKNKRVYIGIQDNGIGIEEKYLNRIFERFFRVDKSRSKIQGGTGLGLAIVKHTLEAHNQRVYVESKINSGTKFTFSLDRA